LNINKAQKMLDERFGGSISISDDGDYYHLTGTAETWQDAVNAGLMCAKKGSRKHVVSDVTAKDSDKPEMIMPEIQDDAIDGRHPDVLVIGGGVTGCAIARELTKEKLDVMLIEKEYDVALHASSRNAGMVHPGLDIKPGMLKKKMNNRGNAIYGKLCEDLGVPFRRCGQYVCFNNALKSPIYLLSIIYFDLTAAGKAHFLTRKQLLAKEPGVSDEARCALFFDATGIVSPYGVTIALAENAADNGAEISLDTAVTSMDVKNGHIESVSTNRGTVYPKVVINAAGVFSEDIARMAGDRFFSIHPREGTIAILDKKTKPHLSTIVAMGSAISKTGHTKGGGVVSTVDGNVLIGPDAVETTNRENFYTDHQNITFSFDKHRHSESWINEGDIITYFKGIRAATYEEDFIIENGHKTDNIIHAAGIQSPGLTSAPAIGLEIEKLAVAMLSKTMKVEKNPDFQPKRRGIIKPKELSDEDRAALIKSNPDYGQIICRCEEVSLGEILDAMRRSVPCYTVDSVKRRCRPGMGRCQGGFCGQQVLQIIAKEKGIPLEQVRKGYPGSEILIGSKGGRNE